MTKLRQPERACLLHPTTQFFPQETEDTSPAESCITQGSMTHLSATSSSSCSAGTSMEQLVYPSESALYAEELGRPDGSINEDGTTREQNIKRSSNVHPQQQESEELEKTRRTVTGQDADLDLETASTDNLEGSKNGCPTKASSGIEEKRIIAGRSGFTSISDLLLAGNDIIRDTNLMRSPSQVQEPANIVKSYPRSNDDLTQLAVPRTCSDTCRVKAEDSPNEKRYGSSQSLSSQSVWRTFPSPGTPSRSSFSGIPASANQKAPMLGRNSVSEFGKGLRSYLPVEDIRSAVALRALPSKWDDAEKWLINASPSHPQLRSPARASLQSTNAVNVERKKNSRKRQPKQVAQGARTLTIANNELQSRAVVPLFPNDRLQATVSDSEVSNNHEERQIFVRCSSQKQKDGSQKKIGRKTSSITGDMPIVSGLESVIWNSQIPSPSRATNAKERTNKLFEERNLTVEDPGDSCALSKSSIEKLRREPSADVFTQDIHPDRVVENVKHGFCLSEGSNRLVVQAPKSKSAAMRDAATEISPKVSKRDMGTQITPLGSSRTSRSTTPIRSSSPVRHNTPARRSGSWSNPGGNLLELESCHLAKLESREIPKQRSQPWAPEAMEQESSTSLRENSDVAHEVVKENFVESTAAAWEEARRSKHMAKSLREEAKIQAWENHQKAKAEEQLKKLEMKLEKLRSQETEKIMTKMAAAHRRAEQMRAVARAQQAEHLAGAAERANHIRRSGYFPEAFGVCFAGLS